MGLDTKQINNLCTGVKLAAELKSQNPTLRKFLTVQGYSYNDEGKEVGLTNVLKPGVLKNICFEVRCYELSDDYFINNWYVTEDVLASEVYQDDIKGIDALEKELSNYIKDYSVLKPSWLCDDLL